MHHAWITFRQAVAALISVPLHKDVCLVRGWLWRAWWNKKKMLATNYPFVNLRLADAFVRSDSQSFIHSYPDAGGCRPTIRQPAVPTAAPSLHSCCLENSHVVLGLIISWPFSSFDLRLCRLFQRATYQFNQHSNTTFKKKIQYRHNTEGLD